MYIFNGHVDCFAPTVLKPLSAECHVVMDQSSEIVLDTPKVKQYTDDSTRGGGGGGHSTDCTTAVQERETHNF